MKPSRLACLATITLCVIAGPVAAAGNAVTGEKIDSGLGALPHYSKWTQGVLRSAPTAVPGESLDDGLAALPHYRRWKDPSGKDPLGTVPTLLGAVTR